MRRAMLIALSCAFCVAAPGAAFAQDEQVSSRKVLSKVEPQYPALAHAAHITGTAKLLAKVNSNGKVDSIQVLGGHPLLVQTAIVAISHWKWEPSNQPTQETVIVKFSLPE